MYDIPEVQAGFRVVVTNATPIAAYRGAGRPEAAAAIERAVDLFAAEIGMDPAEVRRRNFIAPDKFPFQTKTGALYDTGQYAEALDKVLAAAGYDELRQEQGRRRASGDVRQLGIGVSTYVEITAADARRRGDRQARGVGRRDRDRLHRQLAARPGTRTPPGPCSCRRSSASRWTRSR